MSPLNGVQFQFHPQGTEVQWGPSHTITAHRGDQQVGEIHWSRSDGEVNWIKSREEHSGLGTAMWDRASEHSAEHGLPMPQHSNVQLRKGRNWVPKEKARKITRPIPGQQALFPHWNTKVMK